MALFSFNGCLSRIIEVVKNDSLQNILEIEIFNPLEMHETRFSVAKNQNTE